MLLTNKEQGITGSGKDCSLAATHDPIAGSIQQLHNPNVTTTCSGYYGESFNPHFHVSFPPFIPIPTK